MRNKHRHFSQIPHTALRAVWIPPRRTIPERLACTTYAILQALNASCGPRFESLQDRTSWRYRRPTPVPKSNKTPSFAVFRGHPCDRISLMTPKDASSIVRLPLEILEVIIELVPVAAQLCISRLSKLFHSLTLRTLYRNLSLRSPRVVVACCRTLLSNKRTAATVRSFVINYSYVCSIPWILIQS